MLFLSYGRDPRVFNHSCSLVFQCQVAWGTSGSNQNLNSLACFFLLFIYFLIACDTAEISRSFERLHVKLDSAFVIFVF